MMLKHNSNTREKIFYLENEAHFTCYMCLANIVWNTLLEADFGRKNEMLALYHLKLNSIGKY